VPLSRSSIQRSDFPTGRRGYDPAAVDAHLRALADQVEELQRGASQPVAAAASGQVQRIVEAAERTADQLRAEAGDEAREHVARVAAAAAELLERVDALNDDLGELMGRMREDAHRLSVELRSLEGEVAGFGGRAVAEPGPEPELKPEAEPEPEPEPVVQDTARPEDEEAARLVALDMALGGQPREETERYLAEHYRLAEPDRLLDDVYARAAR
jgi:DivIVA domain-containing protein